MAIQPGGEEVPGYHPGHYLGIQEGADPGEIPLLEDEAIRGVIKRYYWRDLEPEQGVYLFNTIKEDLSLLEGMGKLLIVFLTDKSFNGTVVLPDYLESYTITTGEVRVSKRWDPFVIDRFIALGNALSGAFDTEEAFEGIALQESALSLAADTMANHGYTPEKYRDALIETLTGIGDTLHHSQILWYMNFLPQRNSYLEEIATATLPYNVVLSGPDILPYRTGLRDITYPLYEQFHGLMPLACAAQWDSYRHHRNDTSRATRDLVEVPEEGFISMKELFFFARDVLHLNYIFWQYVAYPPLEGAYTTFDALGVMRCNPTFNTSE